MPNNNNYNPKILDALAEAKRISRDKMVVSYGSLTELEKALET